MARKTFTWFPEAAVIFAVAFGPTGYCTAASGETADRTGRSEIASPPAGRANGELRPLDVRADAGEGAQQSSSREADALGEPEIARRLAGALNSELSRPDVRVDPEAQAQLESLSRDAARRLAQAGASEEGVAEAESEMRRLAREIVDRARRRGTAQQRPLIVTRGAVAEALRSLCPLYPIC